MVKLKEEKSVKIEEKPVEKKEVTQEIPKISLRGKELPIPEELVTFDRWFRARSKERKFKPHWIVGMRAYTNTNINRTMMEWDSIFKSY